MEAAAATAASVADEAVAVPIVRAIWEKKFTLNSNR